VSFVAPEATVIIPDLHDLCCGSWSSARPRSPSAAFGCHGLAMGLVVAVVLNATLMAVLHQ
jgi:hypothetical protein